MDASVPVTVSFSKYVTIMSQKRSMEPISREYAAGEHLRSVTVVEVRLERSLGYGEARMVGLT